MTLRDSFQSSGQWLFRRRSHLPLFLFVVVVLAMWEESREPGWEGLPRAWDLFCLGIAFLGLLVRSLAVGTTPAGTSGRNTRTQVACALNTTGLYSVVRHPLYLGNYLMWLGVVLYPGIWWVAVLVSLAFWLYYERIMFAEEEFLRGEFGAEYEAWAARTPAFLPNFRLWKPAALPFSWCTVLRREYSGLYGVIGSITFLEMVANYLRTGTVRPDTFWLALFAGTTLLYLVLLGLKRGTSLLEVQGRS